MIGRTPTNSTVASADPSAESLLPNARVNMSLAIVWVSKLPLVITLTMSKTFITVTISVVTTTPIVGAIWGIVTFQNTWLSLAPSMRAASVSSVGTALIAAEKITVANPVWIQISTTISHMLLNGGSWMKLIGLASIAPVLGLVTNPPTPGPRKR